MLKKIYILIILAIFLSSCKKKPNLHKIKYQITFLEIPHWASSNYIGVSAVPCYYGDYNNDVDEYGNIIQPYIDYSQTRDGLWEYEYWELKDGDKVRFDLMAQLSYWYELRVFIDGREVSYKKVKISDFNYFEIIDLEENGLDDSPGDSSIDFTFHE